MCIAAFVEREFAEVDGASLRRNGPENVRQILEAELSGVFEALKLGVDFKVGLLALDLGFARGALKLVGAVKVDLGRSTLQAVMHGLDGAGDGGGGDGRDRRGRGNGGLGLRGREGRGEQDGKRQVFHGFSIWGRFRDF